MRKVLIVLIVIFTIILGLLSAVILQAKVNDNKYKNEQTVVFTIEEGQGRKEIISNLYQNHLISSELIMQYKLYKSKYIGTEFEFYAGDYNLSESMTDEEVIERIGQVNGMVDNSASLLITEGSTLDTIAENLAAVTTAEDTKQEIIDYWASEELLDKLIERYSFITDEIKDPDILFPLEGYFYPATYSIGEEEDLETITYKLIDPMQELFSTISYQQYTAHELLTLGSIVERETLLDEDKPIAAGVFENRIAIKMPLQSDITVLYAKQEHKEQVLYSDLEYDSPYNTYLYEGLPPGPISTVSEASLLAAANPTDSNYIYFFADQNTGELYFSETLEEHEEIADKYAWEFDN